jgi:hypothetical protein
MKLSYVIDLTIETSNFKARVYRGRITIENRYTYLTPRTGEEAESLARETLRLVARARQVHRKLFGVNPCNY